MIEDKQLHSNHYNARHALFPQVNPETYSEGRGLLNGCPMYRQPGMIGANVEAVLKDGQLFYRLIRPIAEGTELLVWYSADWAQIIGVPDIHASYIKGELPDSCNVAPWHHLASRLVSFFIKALQ